MKPCSTRPPPAAPNDTRASEHDDDDGKFRVGIIGAGVAGLQQARALKERGIACVVFDGAPAPGGLWRENYAGYGVQVPSQLYEFPDFPFKPKANALSDLCNQDYPSGAAVQEYIEAYVDDFKLGPLLELRTRVLKVARRAQGGWDFTTQRVDDSGAPKGAPRTRRFDYCVVATGMYSSTSAFVPEIGGVEAFAQAGGQVLHSSQFTDAALARGKRVLIVGGAKSAIDCAIAAAKAGATSTTLVHRHAHWGTPRLIAWFLPFQYVFLSRLGQLLVSLFKGALPIGASGCLQWFASLSLVHLCMRFVFRIVEELFALQLAQYGSYRPELDVVADFYGFGCVLSPEFKKMRASREIVLVRGHVDRVETGSDLAAGDAVVRERPAPKCCWGGKAASDRLAGGALAYAELEDVEERGVPCDLVVCATGFHKSYAIFSAEEQAKLGLGGGALADGLWLYRHIFPPDSPGLAFCGSEVATISNIATHAIHAEYIARVINAELDLPPAPEMRAEIESMQAWKRSWMPHTASRAGLVLLHQTHYHDQLMADMGLPWARKGNPLAVALMPYQPRDYSGVIGAPKNGGGKNGGGAAKPTKRGKSAGAAPPGIDKKVSFNV